MGKTYLIHKIYKFKHILNISTLFLMFKICQLRFLGSRVAPDGTLDFSDWELTCVLAPLDRCLVVMLDVGNWGSDEKPKMIPRKVLSSCARLCAFPSAPSCSQITAPSGTHFQSWVNSGGNLGMCISGSLRKWAARANSVPNVASQTPEPWSGNRSPLSRWCPRVAWQGHARLLCSELHGATSIHFLGTGWVPASGWSTQCCRIDQNLLCSISLCGALARKRHRPRGIPLNHLPACPGESLNWLFN